jgi:hypothetical protein
MKLLKIKSITKNSKLVDTYDLSVKTSDDSERNFIANGVIVHNSNGIECSFSHHYKRNIRKRKCRSKIWNYF